MRFDPISFGLGFLSASGISWVAWRSRRRLAVIQESAESQIEGTRRFVGRTADVRYRRDTLTYLQRYHVARDLIPLSDIVIEPRLIPLPTVLTLPDSDDAPARSVFDVVPLLHDMPQIYTPFNIETMALDDLGAGDRHVAILGISGLGKSTALATLALMALGEVEFETLEDMTQQAIIEEERGLSKEEREQRAKERERIQERALDKLHDAHAREREKLMTKEVEALPVIDLRELMPVFVHLSDLNLDAAAYGAKDATLDPAEPVVRAVEKQVTAVTAQVVGSVIYPVLEAGQALVLIDGYDELSPAARGNYYYWLQEFLASYGQNMVVIAGPATGYDQLVALGFTPTFLRPWREDDFNQLAKRWSVAWATQSKGRRRPTPPDDQTMKRITVDNRGRTVLDVTLKIWEGMANDARETGRVGWFDALVNRRLSAEDLRPLLPALAAQIVEAGQPIERAKLLETLGGAENGDDKKAMKPDEVISTLVKDGLLVEYAHDRVGFLHPQIAAFLAGTALAQQDVQQVTDLVLKLEWQDALGFTAARITNMMPVIYRKLTAPPDLLYTNLFGLVHWLQDAPPDAPWRGDIFKRLAAALMAPDQYPAVRERAVGALVASRDKNILFILRQALRAADPDVRRLACIGMGALGVPDAITDLEPMLGDSVREVHLAAALALGAIGTDYALEVMVNALLQGTDELRRAVAEALAAIPGEGHAILRDGIESQDIMVRRATVYGLARVNAPWALIGLYRAMLEDEQWYVRAAAEEAFMEAQSPDRDGPRAHPEADALVWLVRWAADRGEGVPAGENARQVLVRVLQEGQPAQKSLAAATLARLGHVPALKPLYAALRDRNPEVRMAAYAALSDLQVRLGEPLPGLN